VILISPVLPGAIGSFVHSGVVQPQEAMTRVKTNGASPEFFILKVCDTLPFASLIVPKSKEVSSAEITALF